MYENSFEKFAVGILAWPWVGIVWHGYDIYTGVLDIWEREFCFRLLKFCNIGCGLLYCGALVEVAIGQ